MSSVLESAPNLLRVALSTSGENRLTALRKLLNLADVYEYKVPLCDPSLALLPSLKTLIETVEEPAVRYHATAIIWFLTRCDYGKLHILSPDTGLLPLLLQLAQEPSMFQDNIINILSNVTLLRSTHDYILSHGSLFFDLFVKELRRRPNFFQLYKCMAGFVKQASPENVQKLIASGVHLLILNHLIQVADLNAWPTNSDKTWAMSFALAFSSSEQGAEVLRKFGKGSYFEGFLFEKSARGLEAAMVFANAYENEEEEGGGGGNKDSRRGMLVDHEGFLSMILNLFEVTIDYYSADEAAANFRRWRFGYGIIQLRDISSALKQLAMKSDNRRVMVKYPEIVKFSVEAIQAFVEDREDYHITQNSSFMTVVHGGGGGKDYETALNLLELLVQLSFYYEEDDALRAAFLSSSSSYSASSLDMKKVLSDLVALPASRNVPNEAKYCASTLLARL